MCIASPPPEKYLSDLAKCWADIANLKKGLTESQRINCNKTIDFWGDIMFSQENYKRGSYCLVDESSKIQSKSI